jgi:hypothetical protein
MDWWPIFPLAALLLLLLLLLLPHVFEQRLTPPSRCASPCLPWMSVCLGLARPMLRDERRSVKSRALTPKEADQRRRRDELLRDQKQRRSGQIAELRGATAGGAGVAVPVDDAQMLGSLPTAFGATADEGMRAAGAADEGMQVESRGRGRNGQRTAASRALAAGLMSPEWLVDIPTDLASRWYVAARPAGKRCLLCSGGGKTAAHGRSGWFRTMPSALPGGSRQGGVSGTATCELDCIWVEPLQTFFVLDLLSWKGHRLADCPAEFRLYWLQTKLQETRAATASSTNPCRVLPLPWLECSGAALQQAYGWVAEDGGERAPKDGLLLMHREALYEAGPSPLQLSWSDAGCSERFYDYGSERMAAVVAAEPDKAARWRTEELEAAWSIADLSAAVEHGMEAEAAEGQAEEAGAAPHGGLPVDQDEIMA